MDNKIKNKDQTINWFGCETTFKKEFDELCKNNSKSMNDNDMDGDFWASYNPRDEWVLMKSEGSNPTNIFQEKIMDHKLVVTNNELMHYANDCETWKHKINGKPQRMIRKFDDEFDEWVKINGWVMKGGPCNAPSRSRKKEKGLHTAYLKVWDMAYCNLAQLCVLIVCLYCRLAKGNVGSQSVVKPKIGNDVEFEINNNFMRELRRKLFKGTDDEDAHEHVQRVLEIADLFHFPDVTHDVVMLRVFPITLKGPALRWINRLSVGLVTTWDLEKAFIKQYYPPFKTAKKLEII
ncbi:hypothetical protein Tco_1533034 [Tanacetum coccineum]